MLVKGSYGTVVALSSGLPPSAIAIVRASGPDVPALANAFGLDRLVPRVPTVRTVRSPVDGAVLDRALCLRFAAPASATGEDVLELHLHGGPALVERVLGDAVTVAGVRLAEPGEFTLRAVLAGRMGLSDAEALADVIEARTEAERRRAARLAGGALAVRLSHWRADIIRCLAMVEAHLDFADEGDVPGAVDVGPDIGVVRNSIVAELLASSDADRLTDGFHVAVIGPPNAGKSSLLNALVRRNVALVSPEAGTTRDVVSAVLDLGGYRVTLHDTAGLREGAQGVEAMGIARTRAIMGTADLVMEVTSPDTVAVGGGDVVVAHKSDLADRDWGGDAFARTATGDEGSIRTLSELLAGRARAGLAGAEAALVTRRRQHSGLWDVVNGLEEALTAKGLEVTAEGLRHAALAMARLTGEIGIDDVLDDVFGRFCIGK